MSPLAAHTRQVGGNARRTVVAFAAILVAASSLVVSAASPLGASAAHKPSIATVPFDTSSRVSLAQPSPPRPSPADARPYIAAAKLSVLSREQLEVHYHAHVDIIANRNQITVPAGIGFVISNGTATGITVLHTHDPSGILHIESASNEAFSLGQAFTEWGVALNANQVGGFKTDRAHVLRTYVNGRRFTGDPATIRLEPHLEIALWYGPSGTKPRVPKSYSFPEGL